MNCSFYSHTSSTSSNTSENQDQCNQESKQNNNNARPRQGPSTTSLWTIYMVVCRSERIFSVTTSRGDNQGRQILRFKICLLSIYSHRRTRCIFSQADCMSFQNQGRMMMRRGCGSTHLRGAKSRTLYGRYRRLPWTMETFLRDFGCPDHPEKR